MIQEQGKIGWDHCRAVRNKKVKRPLRSTTVSTNGSIPNRFNRQLVKVPVGENSGENGLPKYDLRYCCHSISVEIGIKKSQIRLNLRLLAEMVGILPRAKQQPTGLIACGLRTAALFSSAPSLPQKRHQPELMPFVGGDGGYSPAG